jgi:hypothetical protein
MRPHPIPLIAIAAALIGCSNPSEPDLSGDDWLLGRWSGPGIGYSRSPINVEIVITRGERTTPGVSGNVTERGLLITGVVRGVNQNDSISFQTLASQSPAHTNSFRFSFSAAGLKAFPNVNELWPGGCPQATYAFSSIESLMTEEATQGVIGMFISGHCLNWVPGPVWSTAPDDGATVTLRRS